MNRKANQSLLTEDKVIPDLIGQPFIKILPDGSEIEFMRSIDGKKKAMRIITQGNKKVKITEGIYELPPKLFILPDGSEVKAVKEKRTGEMIIISVYLKGNGEIKSKTSTDKKGKNQKSNKNNTEVKTYKSANIIKKCIESSLPVDMLRNCPFLPIDKISAKSKIYQSFMHSRQILRRETNYGTIETRNRLLTQKHKAIFDVMMDTCTFANTSYSQYKTKKEQVETAILEGNSIAIKISIYEIAKRLDLKWGGSTKKYIIESLKEIADTGITIQSINNTMGSTFHIIDSIAWNDDKCKVWLSGQYTKYLYISLAINYGSRINEILAIRGEGSALIRSIVNFFITQKIDQHNQPARISFEKLMNIVGYPTDNPRMKRSAISYINRYKNDLNDFGINFNSKNKLFEYQGTNGIKFIR